VEVGRQVNKKDPKAGEPAIVLKGAKLVQDHRGIRNPSGIASVSRSAVSHHPRSSQQQLSGHPADSVMPQSVAPQKTAPVAAPGVEFSKIAGLLDASHHLSNAEPTRLSIDLFSGSTHSVQSIGRGFLIFLLLVAVGTLAVVPKIRNQTLNTLSAGKTAIIAFARHRKPLQRRQKTTVIEDLEQSSNDTKAALSDSSQTQLFRAKACPRLIREALSGRSGMTLRTRIQIADCFLLKDDPANAEKTLAGLITPARASASVRPPVADVGDSAEAMLTLQSALLKQGNETAANQLVASNCTDWEQSTACVAKLMIAVARRPVEPLTGDANKLFSRRGSLAPKSTARLWLGGAQLAVASGASATVVAQRFKFALAAAPKDALALRKEIYEAHIVEQWQRGDSEAIKTTLKVALRDLASVAKSDLIKLKLISELADAGTDNIRLHALLTREDILFRVRGDLDLLDILGPEALRAGLTADFNQLLHRTRDYYTTRYHAGVAATRRLAIWEVRCALAKSDTDGAIALLSTYAKSYGDDVWSHHLRGAAYTSLTSSLPYQRLAIPEFQAALRLKRDWEPLYGLGAALIRAHRTSQIPPLLADLNKLTRSPGQRYWLDMLRAELALAQNNYPDAQKILTPYAQEEPAWVVARTMQLQVYQKTGKRQLAEQYQSELKAITGRSPYATSFEGFASPIGCMALAKRPLE